MLNWELLGTVPILRNYTETVEFRDLVSKYTSIWQGISDVELDKIALIRALECSNGVTQYALRNGEDYALTVEQTRLCMKTSMRVMNTKQIEFPNGHIIKVDESLHQILDNVREIYIAGFKHHNQEKVKEFYAISVSQFYVLGEPRINAQFALIQEHFADIFTAEFIELGRKYIYKFLKAIEATE